MKVFRSSEFSEQNEHPQNGKKHLILAKHGEVLQVQHTMHLDFIQGMFSEYRYENFSVDRTLFKAQEDCLFEGCIDNPEPLLGISYAIRGDVHNVFSDDDGKDANAINKNETAMTLVMGGKKTSTRHIGTDIQESGHIYLPTKYLKSLAERYPDEVGGLFRSIEGADHNIPVVSGRTPSPILANCLQNLFLPPILGNCSENFMEQQLVNFISHITQSDVSVSADIKASDSTLRDKMHDALYLLRRNYRQPLSLRELAIAVGTNECYLKSGFRREFHQSVYAYLFEYRMQMAVRYLLDTQKSIEEISMLVGYEYAGHFITAFKRRFRITPLEFRIREHSAKII